MPVTNFKAALGAFLTGELDFAGLERALAQVLQAHPQVGPELLSLIHGLYRAGRLPQQVYAILRSRIQPAAARPAQGQPPPAGGPPSQPRGAPPPQQATGPPSTPGQPPGAGAQTSWPQAAPPAQPEDSDKTVLKARATPPPDDDKTRLGAGHRPPGGRTGPSQPGQSYPGPSYPGTSYPSSSQTGTTGATDSGASWGTGSSWGDPAQWGDRPAQPIQRGTIIKNRFILENILGRGGMGIVFKAKDIRKEEAQDRNPYVAIKILNEEFKRHPESLKALQREARKAQDLAHPNVVTVFDFDRDGATVYMTMEYLEGESLDKITKGTGFDGLPEKEAMPIIEGMSQALSYAHKNNVVHSDFKPANVFLTEDGATKVFDFGIARAAKVGDQAGGETTLFDAGTLGALTPAYASCEMIEGEEPDARDDIYGLGCVTYELLTGRHPFKKMSAAQARDGKLQAEPIRGLSRTQWKGVRRALAFSREHRTPSVDQFLGQIRRRRLKKWQLAGAAAAAVLLVGGGVVATLSYLHARDLNLRVTTLESGRYPATRDALASLVELSPEDRNLVTDRAEDAFVTGLESYVLEITDAAQGRYAYPEAEHLLELAEPYYGKLVPVDRLKTRLEDDKNAVLFELTDRFNAARDAGRLLPVSGQDDVKGILEIVAQIEPEHELLGDPRLLPAYQTHARAAIEQQDYQRARALLDDALVRFPDDATLVDLGDQAGAALRQIERASLVAQLETRLVEAGPQLRTLADFDPVRAVITELRELDPGNIALANADQAFEQTMDRELASLLEAQAWSEADGTLQRFAAMLSADYLQNATARLAAARSQYDQQLGGILDQLNAAIEQGKVDQPAGGSAMDLLGELEQAGATASQLADARTTVVRGVLNLARGARNGGELDQAQAYLDKGLALEPGETMVRLLQSEGEQIALARQLQQEQLAAEDIERIEREQQEKIQALVSTFNRESAAGLSLELAREKLTVLEELQGLDPGHPLLSTGGSVISTGLAGEAGRLRAAGQWDEAVALASGALTLSRQSRFVTLDTPLLERTVAELELAHEQYLAQQESRQIEQETQRIEGQQQRLAELLANPAFDASWEQELAGLLGALGAQQTTDPDLRARAEQAAGLYLDRARNMRESERFTQAGKLLERGRQLAPWLSTQFEDEQQAVDAGLEAFREKQQAEGQLALIEGLKLDFRTQTRANELGKADATLQKLRGELPATDGFLTGEAPKLLAGAYSRLAQGRADSGDFGDAVQLAQQGGEVLDKAGLDATPERAGLRAAVEQYTTIGSVQQGLQDQLPLDVPAIRAALQEIAGAAGDRYPQLEQIFANTVAARLESLAETDYEAAARLHADALVLFPESSTAMVLPPRSKPATAATPTRGGGRACTPGLAGRGAARGNRGMCFDVLSSGSKGPRLVVVPQGGSIPVPFAIGAYEISNKEFKEFCEATGCARMPGGDPELPVTDVSITDAEAFAAWLTEQTGSVYRIPTNAEWLYAAGAGGKQPATKDYNCVLMGVNKGLQSVRSGSSNGWGLRNYIGNAQEFVKGDSGPIARGGNFEDSMSRCGVSTERSHNGGADKVTGLRIVREIERRG